MIVIHFEVVGALLAAIGFIWFGRSLRMPLPNSPIYFAFQHIVPFGLGVFGLWLCIRHLWNNI